jgi:type I restriction enzyme R subunit
MKGPRADAGHRPRQSCISRQASGNRGDYIGIAQNLKSSLGWYVGHIAEQVGIGEAEALRVLMEIVRAMFRPERADFDYRPALSTTATPQARLAIMAGAIDWVSLQQGDAANED